jgi:hypothetical protein
MYHFNVEKVLLQRALRKTRSESAFENFLSQLELIEELYVDIEQNISSPILVQQARKQAIISLVSALEVFFKDTLKNAYDSNVFEDSELLHNIHKHFYLNDIENIIKHKISVGELLASLFTFHSLRSINKVFSGLIGRNFFNQVNQFEFEIEVEQEKNHNGIKKTTILQEDYKVYQRMQQLYSLRPFITHDQPEKSTISEYQVQNFIGTANLFAFVTDNYLKELIQYKLKKQAEAQKAAQEEEEAFIKEENHFKNKKSYNHPGKK